jgi:predicted GIY-YIG superfamily endonuclease
MEHREGGTSSTTGRNPRLVWFDMVPTRDEATAVEARLKGIIDRNPREIRKMVIHFSDLLKEVGH